MGAGKIAATKFGKNNIIVEVFDDAGAGEAGRILELKTGNVGASCGEFMSEISAGSLRLEKCEL